MALAVWRPQDDAAPHGAGRQLVGVFSSSGQCGDRVSRAPQERGGAEPRARHRPMRGTLCSKNRQFE